MIDRISCRMHLHASIVVNSFIQNQSINRIFDSSTRSSVPAAIVYATDHLTQTH